MDCFSMCFTSRGSDFMDMNTMNIYHISEWVAKYKIGLEVPLVVTGPDGDVVGYISYEDACVMYDEANKEEGD